MAQDPNRDRKKFPDLSTKARVFQEASNQLPPEDPKPTPPSEVGSDWGISSGACSIVGGIPSGIRFKKTDDKDKSKPTSSQNDCSIA